MFPHTGGADAVQGAGGGGAEPTAEGQREPAGQTPPTPGPAAAGGLPAARHHRGLNSPAAHTWTASPFSHNKCLLLLLHGFCSFV